MPPDEGAPPLADWPPVFPPTPLVVDGTPPVAWAPPEAVVLALVPAEDDGIVLPELDFPPVPDAEVPPVTTVPVAVVPP